MFFVIVASVGLKIVSYSYEGTKRDHSLDSLVHLGRTTYGLKNTVKKARHHHQLTFTGRRTALEGLVPDDRQLFVRMTYSC
jgi:hypothetical protein